ncbi:hypothetical protein scyTo_0016799 [Scyliorhinus torazame]|uniref:Kinesin motor domain-containing protein n=1 Tax=Scyliorhinus torazame TaxID=75743 RepID=A0A401PYN8_SCYTO|nr:hypothetical protein [Scyliorhinus torazame]
MANVKVAVRVRPLSKRENAEGSNIIVHVDEKVASIRNLKLDSRLDSPGNTRERNIEFTFDYCYWSVDSDSSNFAPQELQSNDKSELVDCYHLPTVRHARNPWRSTTD